MMRASSIQISQRAEQKAPAQLKELPNKNKEFAIVFSLRTASHSSPISANGPELSGPVGQSLLEPELPTQTSRADAPPSDFALLEGDEAAGDLHVRGSWDPLALIAPELRVVPPATAGPLAAAGPPPEPLVANEVVRAIAWGGDRRRGTARLELAGRFAGAAVRIDAHEGRLSIEVDAPPGTDAAELVDRVRQRLGARGFDVDTTR